MPNFQTNQLRDIKNIKNKQFIISYFLFYHNWLRLSWNKIFITDLLSLFTFPATTLPFSTPAATNRKTCPLIIAKRKTPGKLSIPTTYTTTFASTTPSTQIGVITEPPLE